MFQITAAGAALTGAAIAKTHLLAGQPREPRNHNGPEGESRSRRGRRLADIDCTRDYPQDRFFAHGATRVVETTAGRYREAEGKHSSRFGYRFAIEHIDNRCELALVSTRLPSSEGSSKRADGTLHGCVTAIDSHAGSV